MIICIRMTCIFPPCPLSIAIWPSRVIVLIPPPPKEKLFHTCLYYDLFSLSISLPISISISIPLAKSISLSISMSLSFLSHNLYTSISLLSPHTLSLSLSFVRSLYLSIFLSFFFLSFSPLTQIYTLIHKSSVSLLINARRKCIWFQGCTHCPLISPSPQEI